MMIFFFILKYQGVMVGFKDKLLFSNNKREMTKDLEFFNRNKASYQYSPTTQQTATVN